MFGKKKKILIVDDDEMLVNALALLFTDNGYKVFTAYSGAEGKWKAVRYKPDLIILDLMLPRVNGYSLCEQIRKDPKTDEMVILMLSAKTGIGDIEKGFNCGANDYIMKPFQTDHLLEKVGLLLGGKSKRLDKV